MGMREKKLAELLRSGDFSVGAAYRASSIFKKRESDDVRREKRSASVLFARLLRSPPRSGIALSSGFSLLRKRSVIAKWRVLLFNLSDFDDLIWMLSL